MTVQKRSPKQHWRQLIQIPTVLFGFAIAYVTLTEKINFVLGITLFALTIFCTIILSFVLMRTYKCPDCSGPTTPASGWWRRFQGKKIPFHCPKCDIDWDFGVSGQED